MKRVDGWSRWFAIPAASLLCAGILVGMETHAHERLQQSYEHKSFEAASVHARAGLECMLHPPGSTASKGIPVSTDDDGYARFQAVRATGGDAIKRLALDCSDSAGKVSSYRVDLTSNETFAAHPLDLGRQRGTDRPALAGDPLAYTQAELIHKGYGLRPDPVTAPAAYAHWLATATKPGRTLHAKHPHLQKQMNLEHGPWAEQAPWWAGGVLTGTNDYSFTYAVFNVPQAIPGGDGTDTTAVALWNGLGGFNTGSGLIQGGVNLYTSPWAASYGTWREYCCGDPDSNGYGGAFTPSPGDQIFSEEWYCDASGDVNLNGGYGCTFLYDYNSGAYLDCSSATGSPCWSVAASPGMTFGSSAEFVLENQSPQVSSTSTAFTDFTPAVVMAGSAYSQSGYWSDVSTDASVTALTDFTNTSSHLVVTLDTPDQTIFTMEPSQPSYPLYCQGPLNTSSDPTPTTVFTWASTGAGYASPGPGECVWADRGPRPGEVNAIYGWLNQLANLPAGQYGEIGVYRDPNFGNELVVTQIVGFVAPPFSPSPTLP